MRADKPDKDHLRVVPDQDDEPVFIATNVKDRAVVGKDTGAAVVRLDVGGGAPGGVAHFAIPGFERRFRIPVRRLLPECSQGTLGNDPHGHKLQHSRPGG
jgi:hypothetical protein